MAPLLCSCKSPLGSARAQLCRGCVEFADKRTLRLKVSLPFPTFQLSKGDITAFYKPLKHQDIISASEVRRRLGHSSANVDLHKWLSKSREHGVPWLSEGSRCCATGTGGVSKCSAMQARLLLFNCRDAQSTSGYLLA